MKKYNIKIHTDYSILNGCANIIEYIEEAKRYNMDILCLTDNNLSGAIQFYYECIENNIKPIIGLEVHHLGFFLNGIYNITLIAKNYNGYLNLIKISSLTELKIYKESSITELTDIFNCIDDVIVLVGGYNSEIMKLLNEYDYSTLISLKNKFKEIFKEVYFEIPINMVINKNIMDIYLKEILNDCKYIFSDDVYYLNEKGYIKRELVHSIKNHKNIDFSEISELDKNLYLKDNNYFINFLKFYEFDDEILTNVDNNWNNFIKDINIQFENIVQKFPKYSNDKDFNENDYLKILCYENLKSKYIDNYEIAKQKLDYELEVISKKNYSNYFLIVYDIVNYANKNNILVGPGRGSAAGSIVSYLLNITKIDPIRYGLIFERFLNINSNTLPDIDLDIESENRETLINYVIDKYGIENVFYINTFSTFKKKQAIIDISKIFQIEKSKYNKVLQAIESNKSLTMNEILKVNKKLQFLCNSDIDIKKFVMYVCLIEGVIRQNSVHAAGIIISPNEYSKEIAYCLDSNKNVKTQSSITDLEKIGFIKMDLLSLINLSILKKLVNEIGINLDKIPLDDVKTYELLNNGNTSNIFQLESKQMTNIIMRLKVKNISDIALAIALYRPGPIKSNMIEKILNNKNAENIIEYNIDALKPILEETYGAFVYQEQILKTFNILADYKMEEADKVRKAISKKNMSVLHENRKLFCEKLNLKGIDNKISNKLYDDIEKFGEYSFNKSHSVAYAHLVYYLSYFKANYPYIYFNVCNEYTSVDIKKMYFELIKMGYKIKTVDINNSEKGLKKIDDNTLLLGFNSLNFLNEKAYENIINNRKYNNIFEFIEKNYIILTKQQIENLIYLNAFNFGYNVKTLINNLDSIYEYVEKNLKNSKNLVENLFNGANNNYNYSIVEDKEFNKQKLIKKEFEILGFNITYNYDNIYYNLKKVIYYNNIKIGKNLYYYNCILNNNKKIKILFDDKIFEYFINIKRNIINEINENDECIYKLENNSIKYIIPIYDIHKDDQIKLYILYNEIVEKNKEKLKILFTNYPGKNQIILKISKNNKIVKTKYYVEIGPVFVDELLSIIGKNYVKIII